MKKIYEMSRDEIVSELRAFCITRGECKRCELSLINHLGDINVGHRAFDGITDRHCLILMVAIARGYLVWDKSRNPDNREEFNTGSNVPEQPTVPPMPEPVKSVISQMTELTESTECNLLKDGYADATQIVISGKKPSTMTVFFGETDGEETDGQTQA